MLGLLVWFGVTSLIALVLRAIVGHQHLSQRDAQRLAGDIHAAARGPGALGRRYARRAVFRAMRRL